MELPSRSGAHREKARDRDREDDEEEERGAAQQEGEDGDQDDKQPQLIDDEDNVIQKYQQEQQAHMALLLDSLTPEQREQHDKYRISRLDLQEVRRIMQAVTGVTTNSSKKVQTVMAGIAKVFAGQIIEEARRISPGNDPLEPRHIRAALRNLRAKGQDPSVPAPSANVFVGRRRGALWR